MPVSEALNLLVYEALGLKLLVIQPARAGRCRVCLCCRTQLLRCQYLYFGTSKVSKVSTLVDVPRVEGLGHTEGEHAARELHLGYLGGRRLAYVSIRQHTPYRR